MVERLFLAVPMGCLRFVIVVFPDHTHLLFFYWCGLEQKNMQFGIFFSSLVFFNGFFLSRRVSTFRGQKEVKHGGRQGISFVFIDLTRSIL